MGVTPAPPGGLSCVVNVSEGRDARLLDQIAAKAGPCLIDLHRDPDHNRSVLTLASRQSELVERAVQALVAEAVAVLDIGRHHGVHPRFGVVDVVPFVPLVGPAARPARTGDDIGAAMTARQRFTRWADQQFHLPCFVYGPERSLPEVRRRAFVDLLPDTGPPAPHPTAGACAVGARPALVAYNVWLTGGDVALARRIAAELRRPGIRTLGLAVGDHVQVSCNLIDPYVVGPGQVLALVDQLAEANGTAVARAELVGLAPAGVVEQIPPENRTRCDVDLDRTVEMRMTSDGLVEAVTPNPTRSPRSEPIETSPIRKPTP